VSIWDESKNQWVGKEDTGTESYTEKEKGLASDSFKRACFNWGIGRELYTAPFIWISENKINWTDKNGKKTTYDKYHVSQISYLEKAIAGLEIKNQKNIIVFSMNAAPIDEPNVIYCVECNEEIINYKSRSGKETSAASIRKYSLENYGRCLCLGCQQLEKEYNRAG
jgi:hypothetical protein